MLVRAMPWIFCLVIHPYLYTNKHPQIILETQWYFLTFDLFNECLFSLFMGILQIRRLEAYWRKDSLYIHCSFTYGLLLCIFHDTRADDVLYKENPFYFRECHTKATSKWPYCRSMCRSSCNPTATNICGTSSCGGFS